MKKTILLFCLSLLILSLTYAQSLEWAKSMGGANFDIATDIEVDADGNVYTTGYFHGTVDFDPSGVTSTLLTAGANRNTFIQKLNKDGNLVWAKSISGPEIVNGLGIAVDKQGNVYSIGYFLGTVDFDPNQGVHSITSRGRGADTYIQKLDSTGNLVWVTIIGAFDDITPFSIMLDDLGHIYTMGSFRGTVDFDPSTSMHDLVAVGATDMFVQKLDTAGNFLWAKGMGGTFDDQVLDFALDGEENVYLTGYFQDIVDFDPGSGTSYMVAGNSPEIFIQKLDSAGNFVWAKEIDGGSFDNGWGIATDTLGHVYITGSFGETADFDPGVAIYNLTAIGEEDAFILKLTTDGNFVWAKNIGGLNSDAGNYLLVDGYGDLYLTGTFESTVDFDPNIGVSNLTSSGLMDVFLLKLHPDGDFVWAKKMGGGARDEAFKSAFDDLGNIHLAGYFEGAVDIDPNASAHFLSSNGSGDIFVLKLTIIDNTSITSATPSFLTLSPNPSQGLCYIELPPNAHRAQVQVIDNLGKRVSQHSLTPSQNQLNLSHLTPGLYHISMTLSSGEKYVGKIILE